MPISFIAAHKNVKIVGIPRLSIDVYGMPADDKESNPMGMEHGQEIELIRKKIHQSFSPDLIAK